MELITFQKNQPQWKASFMNEAKLLKDELGEVVTGIHHVGSTAIPDLLAKPIIDIAIEAAIFPPSVTIVQKLKALGYECKGEAGVQGRYWFTKGEPRQFNLHWCTSGSAVVKKQLAFRDQLIKSFQLRKAYEHIKLNNYHGRDVDSFEYAQAKSSFIEKISSC